MIPIKRLRVRGANHLRQAGVDPLEKFQVTCTTFCISAAASARAICMPISMVTPGESGPARRTRSASVSPSTSSLT